MSGVFRILHVSDLHFGEAAGVINIIDGGIRHGRRLTRPTAHSEEATEALARHIFLERANIDLLLLTGDLATTGGVADLEAAYEFLTVPSTGTWHSAAGEPTVSPCAPRLRLIPGNHDRYATGRLRPYSAGGRLFDDFFSHWWAARQGVQRLATLGDNGCRLAVLGADFTLRDSADASGSATSYLGQGRAYAPIVTDLVSLTTRTRNENPDVAIVWALHFPPAYSDVDPDLELLESESVLQAASDSGVQLIFTGHTHERRVYSACHPRRVCVLCADAATLAFPPDRNGFQLVTLTAAKGRLTRMEVKQYGWWGSHVHGFAEFANFSCDL